MKVLKSQASAGSRDALYEMRPLSPERADPKGAGLLGSSGSSLHAKTFSVDRARFFVGSFNFDPRSGKLNTESGFVIDSPPFAQGIEAAFKSTIPANAYEVRLSKTGQLYWIERRAGRSSAARHGTRHERLAPRGGLVSVAPPDRVALVSCLKSTGTFWRWTLC